MPVELPSEKTPPTMSASTAKVLLYGAAKTGKTTLALNMDPDHTLFLACEPGLDALEAFEVPIRTWVEFCEACAAIEKDDPDIQFKTIVVDPVGDLYGYCLDYTLAKNEIKDPSANNSRGYTLAAAEFRRVASKLMGLGRGVWFIAHSDDRDIKTRTGEITKTVPELTGKTLKFLSRRVDFIVLMEVVKTTDGEVHQLRTVSAENYEAGGRYTLIDPIPQPDPVTGADALRNAINDAIAGGKVESK